MTNENMVCGRLSAEQTELQGKMRDKVSADGIKAVSFKVWEILCLLPFAETEDIYALMENDFAPINRTKRTFTELRCAAQQTAEKKVGLEGSVTLDKIYDILMKESSISEDDKNALMKRECEIIVQYAVPRNFGKVLFDAAKIRKRKIFMIYSGIYPRDVIAAVLDKCGYSGGKALIIPGELNIPDAAESGYLEPLAEKAKCSNGQIIHIGSDIKADVESPVMRGMKSLLLQETTPLMIKSGRFRGYIQAKYIYDYDTADFFAFRCVLGLYRLYGFDVPQNKAVKSDFCGNAYMMGFLVLGALSLISDYKCPDGVYESIARALRENPETAQGEKDFKALYSHYFGRIKMLTSTKGCDLPLEFLVKHAYATDREILKPYLSESDFEKWVECSCEPDLAPVYSHKVRKNALQRLADRLFPPHSRVRNITEDILGKMKKIRHRK